MKLETTNLEDMVRLFELLKQKKSITVNCNQDMLIRISIVKNPPSELDSWIAIDDAFTVSTPQGSSVLSDFDYLII